MDLFKANRFLSAAIVSLSELSPSLTGAYAKATSCPAVTPSWHAAIAFPYNYVCLRPCRYAFNAGPPPKLLNVGCFSSLSISNEARYWHHRLLFVQRTIDARREPMRCNWALFAPIMFTAVLAWETLVMRAL